MAARQGQKIKLLCLLDILRRQTDEDHPLSAGELCRKLGEQGVTAERKSIYSDIETLVGYGFDILCTRVPKSGYFMASREFEVPEVYLLMDAVRSADFISAKKSRELAAKLGGMLSVHQERRHRTAVYYDRPERSGNEEIYYLIDGISTAIETGKKISFEYKNRVLADGRQLSAKTKKMTVSPYALTWQDDHYYLIANYEKYDNLMHLRVDRMHGVSVLEEVARPFGEVSEYKEVFDIADYTAKRFGMYSGEAQEITLRCKKEIIEQVTDRFSDKIFIRNVEGETFEFSAKSVVSDALVTWILHYGASMEVLAPEALKERVRERARAVLNQYSEKPEKKA